jgi:hypothetical protein
MAADHLDPLSELAAFDSAAQELLRLCDDDPARLGAVASAVSGWSALGHVAHVSLANELVLKNLASLYVDQLHLTKELIELRRLSK